MTTLIVGDNLESSGSWFRNGVEVTTGTAAASYWKVDGAGARQYLQPGDTLAPAFASFALTYDATRKFCRTMAVPEVLADSVIYERISHSVEPEVFLFEHRVSGAAAPTGPLEMRLVP